MEGGIAGVSGAAMEEERVEEERVDGPRVEDAAVPVEDAFIRMHPPPAVPAPAPPNPDPLDANSAPVDDDAPRPTTPEHPAPPVPLESVRARGSVLTLTVRLMPNWWRSRESEIDAIRARLALSTRNNKRRKYCKCAFRATSACARLVLLRKRKEVCSQHGREARRALAEHRVGIGIG